ELLAVPLVPGGGGAVGCRHHGAVQLGQHPPGRVLVRQGHLRPLELARLAERGERPGRGLGHQVDLVCWGGVCVLLVRRLAPGGKLSRWADPRESVNCWRSSRRLVIFVPRSRCRWSGPDRMSSMATSRRAAVEYCIDSRFCNWRSPLSAISRPPRLNGECSRAT